MIAAPTLVAISNTNATVIWCLHTVFHATVLSTLLYYLCAWSGFCSAEGWRLLFINASISIYALLNFQLFQTFLELHTLVFFLTLSVALHVLRSVLLPCARHTYSLRQQTHDFELLTKSPILDETSLFACFTKTFSNFNRFYQYFSWLQLTTVFK
jgi:hypothetical protein